MLDREHCFQALRMACGYVEDGSNEKVVIWQDEVTKRWSMTVGEKDYFVGVNLQVCLAQAFEHYYPDDPVYGLRKGE